MGKNNNATRGKDVNTRSPQEIEARRRKFEAMATTGLLLLAVGLVAPFTSMDNHVLLWIFKIVFSLGAVLYLVARIVGGSDPGDSKRLRRLHRMEIWAGICFVVAAGFWYYNSARFSGFFSLAVMRDTVAFTLAGAVIQIVSSWMIASARAKQQKERSGVNNDQ